MISFLAGCALTFAACVLRVAYLVASGKMQALVDKYDLTRKGLGDADEYKAGGTD